MSFASPLLLLSLIAVPLAAVGWYAVGRRRMRYALVYTNVEVLAEVTESEGRWRRRLPPILALLALTAICTATARPQVSVQARRDQATVVLLVDVSRSMIARDVRPSRLGAARAAIRLFLRQIPSSFNVGIVAFSTTPTVTSPVTSDRSVTLAAVDYLQPEFGTAIGDGLALAVKVAREAGRQLQARDAAGRAAPASILLLSDGAQRSGLLQPEQGARRARDAGIRVYTIALGRSDAIVKAMIGGFEQPVHVPPDPATLRRVAALTNGEFFPAPTASALRRAYQAVGSKVASEPRDVEATGVFAAAGAVLLLGAGVLSTLWSSRLP